MSKLLRAWGAGVEDGARHFFKSGRTSLRLRAGAGALKGSHHSTLQKAQIVSALAVYMAKTASPIGLATNTYYSVKKGAESFNTVRDQEYDDAFDALFDSLQPDEQEALRRAVRNPALADDSPVVVGPHTAGRINAVWKDFDLGYERTRPPESD